MPHHDDNNYLHLKWRDFEISASGALGIGAVIVLVIIGSGGRAFGLW